MQQYRDGKNNDEDIRRDNPLGHLMPALFWQHFEQQKGSLTPPRSNAAYFGPT